MISLNKASLTPAVAAAAVLMLAGCQSAPESTSQSGGAASNESHQLARRLGENIGRCWFGPGESAFAGYIYSPEPNAMQPRVLIVPKSQPAERPLLVVETRSATTASIYGPLLQSSNGPRIRADIDRWTKGGQSCT